MCHITSFVFISRQYHIHIQSIDFDPTRCVVWASLQCSSSPPYLCPGCDWLIERSLLRRSWPSSIHSSFILRHWCAFIHWKPTQRALPMSRDFLNVWRSDVRRWIGHLRVSSAVASFALGVYRLCCGTSAWADAVEEAPLGGNLLPQFWWASLVPRLLRLRQYG